MRIECPDCAAAYQVPEDRLSGEQTVRCSRCGTQWVIRHGPPPARVEPRIPERIAPVVETPGWEDTAPIVPEPRVLEPLVEVGPFAPEPAAPERKSEPRIPAMQRLAQPMQAPPRRNGALVGWIISLVVIVLLCWAAVGWRAEIMHAWPPSTRAYAVLGLTGTGR